MKKYLLLMLVTLTGIVTSCSYDDDELWGSVNDLANRVSAVEALTKQKNSDIAAMQAIVNGLENQVSVSEVENLTDGYILHFTDGTSVTIKNGKDGKDGADGEDGKNGADGKNGKDGADGEDGKDGTNGTDGKDGKDAPSIFVAQENGVWYWTITVNGETTWLTDEQGRKIEVVSKGAMDGADGYNGVTPQLRIVTDKDGQSYWEVSLNNGNSYTRIQYRGEDLVAQNEALQGAQGPALFNKVEVKDNKVIIEVNGGPDFELLYQKAVIFYDSKGNEVNTKNTPLNGNYSAEYTFKLEVPNAKFEVVAEDDIVIDVCGKGSSGTVDYNNMTVSVDIQNDKLTEARAVILFFSENKTITAVFKFSISPWDGKTVTEVTENSNGEYEISFPSELAWVAQRVNKGYSFEGKTIKLMYDIDLAGKTWKPIGTLSSPFKGTFNGNGKVVKNLNVGSGVLVMNTRSAQSRAAQPTTGVGMFGVAENATFQDVTISNAQTNSSNDGAAGILVGVTTGTTEISGVTIENGTATATGYESAAGLLVGKATGSITVSDVTITATSSSDDPTVEAGNQNKVEAAYSGGIVGHVAAESVTIENAKVTGLDLGINAENGEAAAGGAVLGKIEPATEEGSINLAVTGAEVESVKVAVSSESTSGSTGSVSVGAVAGAITNAGNANIQIADSNVSNVQVETETEEAATNINQGSVLGNLNEVMEANPQAGAEILENNTVDSSVEIKNQMKIESLNAMFESLAWNMEEYSFDIDGEIQESTELKIPNKSYNGKLNLNFKNLATSESAKFTLSMPYGNPVGMVVNLDFNPEMSNQHVIINLRDVTVNLQSGHFKELTAATAANTLNIKDGVTVDNLNVRKGNVSVEGTGKITGSINNISGETVYMMLLNGATAENNLPAEENIGANIEISETLIITNTELARGLAQLLGGDKVTIDENGYGVMRSDVAETVTQLDFRWRGFQITDMNGFEYFTNLENLYMDGYLTECDFSKIPSLKKFEMRFANRLKTAVDFSNNPDLEYLDLGYVYYVPEINLTGCSKLNYLNLQNNRAITNLDLSGCTSLVSLYTSDMTELSELDLSGCSSLKELNVSNMSKLTDLNLTGCKQLERLDIRNTRITALDLTGINNLKDLNIYGTSLNELIIPNPQSLTKLDVSNTSIDIDLNKFTGLTDLAIGNRNLETLDFIPNNIKAKLQSLKCYGNHLQYIDMSLFRNLTSLDCSRNQLRTLDLSAASKLQTLSCEYNRLTSLNVSGAKSLNYLSCGDNYIETLDVSSLKNLQNLYCSNQQNVLTLTISEDQKQLWTERWKGSNNGVRLDSEIIKDPEAETGGNGFGNGGKI